jgi:biopolymer transport protein ExbB
MTLFDYVNQGGVIMYILLLANIIGLSILGWKLYVVLTAKKNLSTFCGEVKNNFVGLGVDTKASSSVELLKDQISGQVHRLEAGLNVIKIIATTAPLLGLLGTVIGIFEAFNVISKEGLNNPSLFAGGISLALITTVGGLIVAIPHYIGYNYLMGILDDIEVNADKELVGDIFGKGA